MNYARRSKIITLARTHVAINAGKSYAMALIFDHQTNVSHDISEPPVDLMLDAEFDINSLPPPTATQGRRRTSPGNKKSYDQTSISVVFRLLLGEMTL